MKKIYHAIIAIFSITAGYISYEYIIPELRKYEILDKIICYPYWKIDNILPDTWYFPLLSIIIAITVFLILELCYYISTIEPDYIRNSSHWATLDDLRDLREGVAVGRVGPHYSHMLHLSSHIVTCAGTGAGKGIGAVVPTLLTYPNSIICLDIKGENCDITLRHRKTFNDCYVINPFYNEIHCKYKYTDSFNWLDIIDTMKPTSIDLASMIASSLVGHPTNPNSNDEHFRTTAIRIVKGTILMVCTDPNKEDRNIVKASKLLTRNSVKDLCIMMQEVAFNEKRIKCDAVKESLIDISSGYLNSMNTNEMGGFSTTIMNAIKIISDNPAIQNTVEKSTFSLEQLTSKKTTVYIIIPQNQLSEIKGYIRVFFDLALYFIDNRKDNAYEKVLLLLDEVAQLDYMKSIVKAISYIRGKGGQMWLFFQSVSQLNSIYGKDANTILENASQIFYGCNDIDTCEKLSKTIGNTFVKIQDRDTHTNKLIERPLLTPDEIRIRPPEQPIIIVSGKPAIDARRINYLRDKEYQGLYDDNTTLIH